MTAAPPAGTPAARAPQALAVAVMGAIVVLAALAHLGPPVDPSRSATSGASTSEAIGGDAAEAAALEAIETGADHVAPEALLDALLRGERPLIVDVRPEDEFREWHLPGAVRMTVPEVVGERGRALLAVSPGREAVLCSNGPGHPGQAWLALVRRGVAGVRVLDGGLDELKDRCLTPPSLRGPISEVDARRAWPLFAARRAFVLGDAGTPPGAGRHATDPASLEGPTVVSVGWTAARLGKAVLVDARESAEDWRRVRLPGALHLAHPALRAKTEGKPHMMLAADEIAARLGALGVDDDAEVVLYGDDRLHDVTFVALALLRAGHRRLALLEGGVLAWAAARLPLEVDAPTASARPATRYFVWPGGDDFTATIEDVERASREGGAALVDARPAPMYRGEQSTEARPGHVPGARNRDLALDTVRTPVGTFWRAREDLAAGYASCGAGAGAAAIASCRTGHSASGAYFALRYLLGNERARWYNGSWTEWAARKDLPAETGAGPARASEAPQ